MNIVPDSERIVGQKYLEKCGHYHAWDPRSWQEREDEIVSALSQEIADQIDAEILEELLDLAHKQPTITK